MYLIGLRQKSTGNGGILTLSTGQERPNSLLSLKKSRLFRVLPAENSQCAVVEAQVPRSKSSRGGLFFLIVL